MAGPSKPVADFAKFSRDLLLSILHDLDELRDHLELIRGDEAVRSSGRAGTTGTSDTMNIVFQSVGEIVVDYKLDVFDIYK